jgi:hypothetical protein
MLLAHFALSAVTLRPIRPDEEYDPAHTQSNRTIRIHEIGLRVLQNEGKFELVGSVHNGVRDTGLPV